MTSLHAVYAAGSKEIVKKQQKKYNKIGENRKNNDKCTLFYTNHVYF